MTMRFKKPKDLFAPTSFVLDHPQLGLIVSIPGNVVEALNLRPDDRLIWLDYNRGIIRLRLKRARD